MRMIRNKILIIIAIFYMFYLSAYSRNISSAPYDTSKSTSFISEKINLETEVFQQDAKQVSSSELQKDNLYLQKGYSEKMPKGSTSSEIYVPMKTDNSKEETMESDEMIAVSITVGNKAFSAKFYNNESAKSIASQMPLTLDMKDFSSQEKVTSLPFDLPSAGTHIPPTIRSGEIYLWSENQMVLFYTSLQTNIYNYVPIGYIEDTVGLAETLGSSSVVIKFSIM